MRRLRSVASLMGLGLMLVSGAATAAPHLAALTPQVKPPGAPEVRDRFHEAVVRGLQTAGDDVLGAAETRLRLGASEELMSCAGTGPCMARVAQALHVDRGVASEIDVNGKDYVVKLRLVDAVGRELAKIDEPCDICTLKEADEAVARAAGKLAAAEKALPPETPPPVAETTPPPKVETPPPKVETPPPPKVETPPPQPPTQVEVTPPPGTEPTPPPAKSERKTFPWRPIAITSLVVGVVGIAVGAPLVAIDGNPTCSSPNPRTSCPNVYNTVGGGATMLTLGIAGVAASAVLFYFDHRARKQATTVSVSPTTGGAYLSVGGQF
ncbi:MAG TPA: hypothetical protein VGL86_18430 [Polyangia bacterium]